MSRLTKKKTVYHETAKSVNDKVLCAAALNKLGKLEDILEEYNIEDLTDLVIALDYYDHRFDGLHTERVGKDE